MALRNQQLLQALMARHGTAAAVPASTMRAPTVRTMGLLEQMQQQYPYQAGRPEMGFDLQAAQSNILPGLIERGMDVKTMIEEPVETGIGLAELGKGALQIAGAAPTLAMGSERARQAARRRLEGNPVAMMLKGGVRELRDLVGEKGVMGAMGSMANRPVDVAEMMLGVVPGGAVPKAAKAAKLIRRDKEFVTGKPVQFEFLHNTESAPDMGSQFGQDIEPAGRYLLEKDVSGPAPPNWETGEISFENPLVIEHGDTRDWKKRLSATYEGKTGQELSDAVRADGHDGIVTIDSRAGHTSEIVDLKAQLPDFADEVKAAGGEIDESGAIRLFHRTTPEAAEEIRRTGQMTGKEDGVFFSTSPSRQAVGYGSEVVEVRIPLSDLELNDLFDTEAHLRLPLKRPGEKVQVEVVVP